MKNILALLIASWCLLIQISVAKPVAAEFTVIITTTVDTEVGIARFKASPKTSIFFNAPVKEVHSYPTEKPKVTIEFIKFNPPSGLQLFAGPSVETKVFDAGYRFANVEELASITEGVKGIKNPIIIAYGSYLNIDNAFTANYQVNVSDKSDVLIVNEVKDNVEKEKSPIAVVKIKK